MSPRADPVDGPAAERAADEAILAHVRPGDTVLLGSGAGEARCLQAALVRNAERLPGLALVGGLQLGGYEFLEPVRAGHWSYRTWHVMPPVRRAVRDGLVEFLPVRGGTLPQLIEHLAPDVFLGASSRPRDGAVSFGASVSYALPAARAIERVVLEANARMPHTRGETTIALDEVSALVDVDRPLPGHRAVAEPPTPDMRRIAELVRGLLPDGVALQTGIGTVSEEILRLLGEDAPPGLVLFGMGTDAMVPLLESRAARLVGGELLGSEALYDYVADHDLVTMHPAGDLTAVPRAAAWPRLVSLQTAIEIDLRGQINSEMVGSTQVSGVGGAFDFLDASWFSEGGTSIFAMTSMAGTSSRIVPRISSDSVVSIPRHSVRHVVTEHGAVDLFPLSVREREEALISIAHPSVRDELSAARGRAPVA
ncbi:acetyl-CoA hydrolase/transferase family protein [Patulibacter sp. S7RM1-6]